MNDLNQLLLKFDLKQNYMSEDFYVNKSNFFAFSLVEKWPKWEKNILNVYGEKYCGKTHLSNIFKSELDDPLLMFQSKRYQHLNEEGYRFIAKTIANKFK